MSNFLKSAQVTTLKLEDHERQRCEVWTRVMGYHRPVSSFNIGKQGEFHERKFFSESRARKAGQI
ncbi:MAG: anaerobic ribonucleoside-triphosphate reductase [Acidiferrobacteraceae bacterium]